MSMEAFMSSISSGVYRWVEVAKHKVIQFYLEAATKEASLKD